jgi:multiple sugar transport system permease protein
MAAQEPTWVLSRREGFLLVLPLLVFLVLLLGFPILADLVYSFSNVSFINIRTPTLSGLGNYLTTLTDPAFWHALWFSLRYAVVQMVVQVTLALALALAFEDLLTRHRGLIAVLLLPMMIAPALLAVMYRLILNEFVGIVPAYLDMLGFDPNLLGPEWVFVTVSAVDILQWTPFSLLILLTALQTIPGELREAARMDGASGWQQLRHVLLPLLKPAIGIAAFIRFIDSFRVFDHIYVLTGGGPGDETTGISIYIYQMFFQQQQLGTAVAASVILLALSLILVWILMKASFRGSTA